MQYGRRGAVLSTILLLGSSCLAIQLFPAVSTADPVIVQGGQCNVVLPTCRPQLVNEHSRRHQIATFHGDGISSPDAVTAGSDGALWFTSNFGNSIGRITSSGAVTIYKRHGIDGAEAITPGPDGALWFTNSGSNSIGRITTSGVVTHFKRSGIDEPNSITTGPDGALWFTNSGNNSIGRVTKSGKITRYLHTGIDEPNSITTGPDGALWFTNSGNNSIGRISTTGIVTAYTASSISLPSDIIAGPERRPLVHQRRQCVDRAYLHVGSCYQLRRHRHRLAPQHYYGARRGPLV